MTGVESTATDDAVSVAVRGIVIRFAVSNPRLRIWAERFAEIEPELLDLIDGMPEGAIFFDLGASIGLFSLYAALRRRARVYAFEPEAQNYATLELNHFLNRRVLVEPLNSFNVAIAESVGVGKIHTRVYGAGEHVKILDKPETQDTKEAFEAAHVQTVLKMPLDHLIREFRLPQPNVLKIDVDGAEAAVLAGANKTLGNPILDTVFIELTDRTQTAEAQALLQHGFRLTDKIPVARLRGGVYPDLFNCIFRR
jgi:FkbM family methyltransferase